MNVRRRIARGDSFGIVLILLFMDIVVLSFTGSNRVVGIVEIILVAATILATLHTSFARRKVIRVVTWILIPVVLISIGVVVAGLDIGGRFGGTVCGVILVIVAPMTILRRIGVHPTIDANTVMGALCIYILIGLFYAWVYGLVDAVTPGGFFKQVETAKAVDYVYFSYVTQATVGYGDFTAAGSLGRILAATEGLLGQLYLVTIVALLVGNLGRTRRRAGREDEAPPGDEQELGNEEPAAGDSRASAEDGSPSNAVG